MEQNYQNHARTVLGFHRVLLILLVAGLIGSGVNLYESLYSPNLYSASLIMLLFVCCAIMYAYVRLFPLKAQDRAIRAEENFRHYILTGKILPSGLTMGQIIALRFASDEELPHLSDKAVKENLRPREIKQFIQKWKADHHRV
ncbi:DUF6526 family protein [Daejeonella lutea]|uniref:Uncharacterized protein n=1 Tax=Daejeonella lutea TaxID=572036 RepID=A0A1T5AMW5_9SPHI|nr:DUF6526 family protein [Daejeonella lutea]SKB35953.1 hypothetical protein SAMN05661099_0852 [Daejeonella lutea]